MKKIAHCLLLALCACPGYCEVLPTGQQQRLFKEQLFETPSHWDILTLPSGKKFQMVTGYYEINTIIQTESGPKPFGQLPWVKDSIIRVEYDDIKDPQSKSYQDLLTNKENSIMLFARWRWWENYDINSVLSAKKHFGKRFLCLDYGEWSWGGVTITYDDLKQSCENLFHIPLPSNRDEGADWWNRDYDRYFKKFQDAGIPIYSWNQTFLSHYEARKGAAFTGNEIGNSTACVPMQIAFCRGASRQYGIPWAIYASSNGWGVGVVGETSYETYIRPEERRALTAPWYVGPLTGHTLSMQKRYLFASYMSGANFYQRENYRSLANYDDSTVEQTDPRILVLQDVKNYQSPIAMFYDRFYNNIVTKHDRGVPYTPVALMFDKNHGFVLGYDRTHIVGNIPYNTADEQMRAVTNTVFPWEHRIPPNDNLTIVSGPFGDIFDVITTEAADAVINSYRAIVLVGEARVDQAVAKRLKEFVEKGGVLFMTCEQMTPQLWEMAGITDTGQMGKDASYTRASDFYTYFDVEFEYHKVKLNGAEPLFLANEIKERIWPVATINRLGKGCMIVGTPVWLKVKGSATQMHGLFSEIMTMIADELAPVRIYGDDVEVMYNKNKNGWVVTLINNEGVIRNWPGHKEAQRDYSGAGVILKTRFKYSQANEWLTEQKFSEDVSIIVPPGEARIIEFR